MMNAPAIDLLAMKGSKKIAIAVKTTGSGRDSAQWSVGPDWATTSLFQGRHSAGLRGLRAVYLAGKLRCL
jgi:hypothetical protein